MSACARPLGRKRSVPLGATEAAPGEPLPARECLPRADTQACGSAARSARVQP
jgi:hypothetical protein